MNSIVHQGRLPEAGRNFSIQPTETVKISKIQDAIWLLVDKLSCYVFKASKNGAIEKNKTKQKCEVQPKSDTNQMYSALMRDIITPPQTKTNQLTNNNNKKPPKPPPHTKKTEAQCLVHTLRKIVL